MGRRLLILQSVAKDMERGEEREECAATGEVAAVAASATARAARVANAVTGVERGGGIGWRAGVAQRGHMVRAGGATWVGGGGDKLGSRKSAAGACTTTVSTSMTEVLVVGKRLGNGTR